MSVPHGVGSRFGWLSDVIHVALGFASALLAYIGSPIGALVALCYAVYQVLDMLLGEDPVETLLDMFEFAIGAVLGALICITI